jgi:arylsulfatase A-like enzyme
LELAGFSAAAFLSWPERLFGEPEPNRPNIVYILADDLGYGHLGCYGQKEIETPEIDRTARQGMKFTDHYAGSALCAPSRCVLMTGLHTGHCFIRNNKRLPVEGNVPIPADSQTIPKLLKKAGYKTAAIGKWGLGYPGSAGDPIKQGFDYFFGYNCQRQAHSYYPPHLWRNDKKITLEGNKEDPKTDYSHDLLTAEALNLIRKNRDNPFFLYVPYTIPHAKFQVPELGRYAEKPWPTIKKAIAAMISRMDRDVGRILELLKSLDLEENTLVIFTSDNGSAGGALLNEFNGSGPLRASKGTLYEGGIRAPMIARWPGKIAPGTTSDHVCGFQDMMPTFAELAGVKVTGRTDGISIVPTLLGKGGQRRHEYLYWELRDNRAVRMGKFKAVKNKAGLQLFDLEKDLAEKTDLAAKHPDVVERMQMVMRDSHEHSPFFTWEYTGPLPQKRSSRKVETRERRKK